MNEPSQYFYSNKLARIVFRSMEEIIGQKSLQSVMKIAGLDSQVGNFPLDNIAREYPFENISKVQEALEILFGPRGSKGLALRTGRVSFKYGLQEFGPLIGVTDLNFRLAPLEQKLMTGSEMLAEIFNRFSDQKVSVDSDADRIYWRIERCPVCWERSSDTPICYLAVGFLEESSYWFSGGKTFHIEETSCIAMGDDSCTIQMDKQVLD